MKTGLVDIKLHGNVFSGLKENYKLAVKSVAEAIHAINTQSKSLLFKTLLENDKKGIKYKVLINGRDFISSENLTLDNAEKVKDSELMMNFNNNGLKTIDIVPIIEGGDSNIGSIILGVVLVIVGILGAVGTLGIAAPISAALIIGGIGLISAGVINLLSAPPAFEDFREISGGGKSSYLFNGPENTVREGGPVAVTYGRLIVGSHVISASYEISEVSAKEVLTV